MFPEGKNVYLLNWHIFFIFLLYDFQPLSFAEKRDKRLLKIKNRAESLMNAIFELTYFYFFILQLFDLSYETGITHFRSEVVSIETSIISWSLYRQK